MRIGIDLGNYYTKVSYLNDNLPVMFTFPNDQGSTDYIRTVVLNSNSARLLGDSACIDDAFPPHRDFKQRIGEGCKDNIRQAEEDLRDFLEEILNKGKSSHSNNGEIEGVCFSVPQSWLDEGQNYPSSSVSAVIRGLGFNDSQIEIESDSICAAAYYKYRYLPEQKSMSNIVVCDIGGSRMDLTLCQLSQDAITNQFHKEIQGVGGSIFDQGCVRKVLPKIPEDPDTLFQIERQLEISRISPEKSLIGMEKFMFDEHSEPDYSTTSIYKFRYQLLPFDVLLDHAWKVFFPMQEKITRGIAEFRNSCVGKEISAVYLVGGFSQNFMISETIKSCFKPIQVIEEDQRNAIAKGACLISNGIMNIFDFFKNRVSIRVNTVKDGILQNIDFPIITPRQSRGGMKTPIFIDSAYQLKLLKGESITVEVNGNENLQKSLKVNNDGEYRIGYFIDRSYRPKIVLKSSQNELTLNI